jgi:hypothetical protein
MNNQTENKNGTKKKSLSYELIKGGLGTAAALATMIAIPVGMCKAIDREEAKQALIANDSAAVAIHSDALLAYAQKGCKNSVEMADITEAIYRAKLAKYGISDFTEKKFRMQSGVAERAAALRDAASIEARETIGVLGCKE